MHLGRNSSKTKCKKMRSSSALGMEFLTAVYDSISDGLHLYAEIESQKERECELTVALTSKQKVLLASI